MPWPSRTTRRRARTWCTHRAAAAARDHYRTQARWEYVANPERFGTGRYFLLQCLLTVEAHGATETGLAWFRQACSRRGLASNIEAGDFQRGKALCWLRADVAGVGSGARRRIITTTTAPASRCETCARFLHGPASRRVGGWFRRPIGVDHQAGTDARMTIIEGNGARAGIIVDIPLGYRTDAQSARAISWLHQIRCADAVLGCGMMRETSDSAPPAESFAGLASVLTTKVILAGSAPTRRVCGAEHCCHRWCRRPVLHKRDGCRSQDRGVRQVKRPMTLAGGAFFCYNSWQATVQNISPTQHRKVRHRAAGAGWGGGDTVARTHHTMPAEQNWGLWLACNNSLSLAFAMHCLSLFITLRILRGCPSRLRAASPCGQRLRLGNFRMATSDAGTTIRRPIRLFSQDAVAEKHKTIDLGNLRRVRWLARRPSDHQHHQRRRLCAAHRRRHRHKCGILSGSSRFLPGSNSAAGYGDQMPAESIRAMRQCTGGRSASSRCRDNTIDHDCHAH